MKFCLIIPNVNYMLKNKKINILLVPNRANIVYCRRKVTFQRV